MRNAFAVILALFYCGGYPALVKAQNKIDDNTMSDTIQAVKQRHADQLTSLNGVIAVGIGLGEDGQQVIIVTLQEGNTRAVDKLPTQLEGYELIIQYSKEIQIQ